MGRNYFSKHGGPYFINDGFSHHKENKPKPSNKKDIVIFACGSIGFIGIMAMISLFAIKVFS